MLVKTRYFGEVDLDEEKVITFENGLLGFEEYKRFTILYDIEAGEKHTYSWLQCLDEQGLALPVISPELVDAQYNPIVEDELLKGIGGVNEEELVILLTMTVPPDITKMTVNKKAPIIINADTRKGVQIIAENPDYEVKYDFYSALKAAKEKEGE